MAQDYWGNGTRRFGHYEEEGEEWEPPSTVRTEPGLDEHDQNTSAMDPLAGGDSVLSEVRLGADMLPEDIRFSQAWQRAVDPDYYGESILAACLAARMESVVRSIRSGDGAEEMPTMRQINMALLQTQTVEEYRSTYRKLAGTGSVEGYGPGINQWGSPCVRVSARRGGLRDVAVDPEWASTSKTYEIQAEFMDAVEMARKKLFGGLSDESECDISDEELNRRVENLYRKLVRAAVYA